MGVCIVTDSTVRFSPEFGKNENLPITVVPLRIRFGDREYRDSVGLAEREIASLAAQSGEMPQALPPTVDDFYRVYTGLNQNCNEIISIHLPEKLSNTIQNARRAANMLGTV